MTDRPYARTFLAHAGPALRAGLEQDLDALEAALVASWQRARARLADLDLPADAFVAHLATKLSDAEPPVGLNALASLHAEDLLLAYGCSVGSPEALAVFERRFMPQVNAYLGRREALAGFTDELKQRLRVRLLVGDGPLLPRIGSYTGRGPLGAWLRVAAARLASNMRQEGGVTATAASLDAEPSTNVRTDEDPELDYLRRHYEPVLRQAMKDALAGLPAQQVTVLRLFFVDALTHEAIAATMRVSDRTVRRWIVEARERLLTDTRARLAVTLAMPTSQLDTIIRLARAQMGPSVVELLRKT